MGNRCAVVHMRRTTKSASLFDVIASSHTYHVANLVALNNRRSLTNHAGLCLSRKAIPPSPRPDELDDLVDHAKRLKHTLHDVLSRPHL